MKIYLPDVASTVKFAELFANYIDSGKIIFLYGDLGVGKTSFARGLIRAFMHDEELDVVSPTFSLLQYYDYNNLQLIHADFYRLEHIDEVIELGLEDHLLDTILLIEWPEIAQPILPKPDYSFYFSIEGEGRNVNLEGASSELKLAMVNNGFIVQ